MHRKSLTAVATAALALTAIVTSPGSVARAADGPGGTRPATDGLLAGSSVVGSQQVCTGIAIICPTKFMFGVSTPRVLTLNSTLTSFESAAGRRADVIGSYQDFTEPMYTTRLKAVIASGRTPMVTWEPFNARKGTKATYPLAKIASGAYDAYLRKSADQAKAVGKPFILRFGHEMNGFWYPWGMSRALHPQSIADKTNTPAGYVKAYRHVVDVFKARKVTNVSWMWSPNVTDANPSITLASLYPGDAYVNVIGVSGYLDKPDSTFESRFRPTLTELSRIGGTKPIIIAETGVMPSANRSTAITQAFDAMSAEPRIAGLVYFAQPDKSIDYRLTSDAAATLSLKTALARPRFRLATTQAAAFATTPVISGTPRVGETLTATYRWRGAPTQVAASWLACPAADSPAAACTRVGTGTALTLTSDHHGQYIRASLGVVSPTVVDHADRTVGPILTVPTAVTPTSIELLGTGVKLHFPAAQPQTTHWIVTLNGGADTYLPAATTTEHYFGSLTTGTAYTITVRVCDGPSFGPLTTLSFTLVAKPVLTTYAAVSGGYTVTLPDAAPGQTGWVAVVDGVEHDVALGTATVTEYGAVGGHTFGLRAVSGTARTNPAWIYPQVH